VLTTGSPPDAGAVQRHEVRLAAYRYASMITDVPWMPSQVLAGIGPIEDYLKQAGGDRQDFELRCQTLEVQTLNLGLHPSVRNPGVAKKNPGPSREPVARVPHPADLVSAARKILAFLDKR
jgi:hypothetical protein